jgi:transcription initiation factor TFIID subunit 13
MMMYGFGDVRNPRPDSVELLEDMVLEYITDLCLQASQSGSLRPNGKIKTDDFLFALRNDPAKLSRAQELLVLNDDLSKARKVFDEKEYHTLAHADDGADGKGSSGEAKTDAGTGGGAESSVATLDGADDGEGEGEGERNSSNILPPPISQEEDQHQFEKEDVIMNSVSDDVLDGI